MHLNQTNLGLIDNLVTKCGLKLHHAKGGDAVLYKWVKEGKKDLVPPYSIHVISCGGVIVKDDRVLLVEEKSGALKGKFGIPGGRADFDEGIPACAER